MGDIKQIRFIVAVPVGSGEQTFIDTSIRADIKVELVKEFVIIKCEQFPTVHVPFHNVKCIFFKDK